MSLFSHWVNGNLTLVPAKAFELNNAVNQCKQGVVVTATNVFTWVDVGTALTVKN